MSCVQINDEGLGGRHVVKLIAMIDADYLAIERIMQTGKKKLVLDHLIVQKMDDQDSAGEDMQSILTFGAKALFDESQESRDITCNEISLILSVFF